MVGIVGGVVTTITCLWMTSRLFDDHQFGRALMLYGNMTGTLSTGIALLRVVDPEFKTPVASDYVYSNGITFALAIPMILLINLPIRWYTTGETDLAVDDHRGLRARTSGSRCSPTRCSRGRRRSRRSGKIWYTEK